MQKLPAFVISLACLEKKLYHLKLSIPGFNHSCADRNQALPGQFIQIYCGENEFGPLLPRPLSLFRINKRNEKNTGQECWEVIFRVVGKGTSWLSQRKSGDLLEILGPLGKGFSLPAPTGRNSAGKTRALLIAGGIGMPPLFALAESLTRLKTEISLFYAGKTNRDLLYLDLWRDITNRLFVATEDGSVGHTGLVTDLVKAKIQPQEADYYYACGPRPMLKAVKTLMESLKIPGELLLEERMACGVGACLGCAIKTTNGYKRVCREGPVFPADEVIFDD